MILKVKKLVKDAIIPNYAKKGDTGLDLYSVMDNVTIRPGERILIKTGIAIELPPNTEAQVRPRSGLALKYGLTVLNTPGSVDNGYRGEIGVILINHGFDDCVIEKGDKIAQLVIKPTLTVKVVTVDKLSDTERSNTGFGSSGRK